MQYQYAAAARVQHQGYVSIVSPKPVFGICPCRPAQHAQFKSQTHVRRKMDPSQSIEAAEGSEGCHVCATLGRSAPAPTTPPTARRQDATRVGSVGPLLSWRCSCKCASSRQSAMQATNYLRRASVTSRVGDVSPQQRCCLGPVFSTSSVRVACNICVDGGQSHYQSCVKLFRLPSFSPPTFCLASAGQGIFSMPESEHLTLSPAVFACTRHEGWCVPKSLLSVACLSRSSHRTGPTIDVCFQKYLLYLAFLGAHVILLVTVWERFLVQESRGILLTIP